MDNNSKNERRSRILETLYKLAVEGKTEGERESAKRRIAVITAKMAGQSELSRLQAELDRQTEINRQAELRRKEVERQAEEFRRRAEAREAAENEKKQETVYKKRAERKQHEHISREDKFAARANWMNRWVQITDDNRQKCNEG